VRNFAGRDKVDVGGSVLRNCRRLGTGFSWLSVLRFRLRLRLRLRLGTSLFPLI
jgi:hypothetical protein